jgi:hypothetical protein
MFKRRLKFLGRILLGLLVLLAAFLLVERWRGQIALASFKKQLLANGEKLSPEDFAPTFNPEDNGAPGAIAAVGRLNKGSVLLYSPPPKMKIVPSGRAIVGFRESEWVEKGFYREEEWINERRTNRWPAVAHDLNGNSEILAEIREALARPVLNNHVDLTEGFKLRMGHLSALKSIALWFGSATQLALAAENHAQTLEWLLPQIRLPRLLADDQTLISELVRIAIGAIALTDTWEALQLEGWSDDDLRSVHHAWESQRFIFEMSRSLEAERILYESWVSAMRASNQACFDGLIRWQEPPFESFDFTTQTWVLPDLTWRQRLNRIWKKQIYCRVWRFAWSHQAQQHGLAAIHALTEINRAATTNQSNFVLAQSITQWTNQFFNHGFYDQLRRLDHNITAMPKSLAKAMRAETDRSLALTAIALKRYQLRHGKYPERLSELVPEFLAAIPVDYMDGQPIKYQRLDENGFLLYSVGEDGRDDGGDLTPTKSPSSRNLWLRRDYVWPAPATPQEVEEFRREASKD